MLHVTKPRNRRCKSFYSEKYSYTALRDSLPADVKDGIVVPVGVASGVGAGRFYSVYDDLLNEMVQKMCLAFNSVEGYTLPESLDNLRGFLDLMGSPLKDNKNLNQSHNKILMRNYRTTIAFLCSPKTSRMHRITWLELLATSLVYHSPKYWRGKHLNENDSGFFTYAENIVFQANKSTENESKDRLV